MTGRTSLAIAISLAVFFPATAYAEPFVLNQGTIKKIHPPLKFPMPLKNPRVEACSDASVESFPQNEDCRKSNNGTPVTTAR